MLAFHHDMQITKCHAYSYNVEFARDLSFNNLTGDLPSSFGSLMNLTSLYVSQNLICKLLSARRCKSNNGFLLL